MKNNIYTYISFLRTSLMPIKLQRIKNYLPRAFSAASTNSGFALALFFIRLAIFDISFSISRSKNRFTEQNY